MRRAAWLAVRACDLVLPGTGAILSGATVAGLAAFAGAGVAVAGAGAAVLVWLVNPIRAAAVAAVALAAIQVLLWLRPVPRDAPLHPGRAALAAMAGAAVLAALVVATCGGRCDLVRVRGDLGLFPQILPGETVAVLHSDFEAVPPARGELVVARTARGLILGRVVAFGGERVEVAGPALTLDGVPIPQVGLGDVHLADDPGVAPEETRSLQAWRETLGGRPHWVFFRRGVDLSPIRHDVPVGQVFLLADNRSTDTALDSRDAGPVPLGELVGRPGPVLWSDGPAGPRFDRLGVRWE